MTAFEMNHRIISFRRAALFFLVPAALVFATSASKTLCVIRTRLRSAFALLLVSVLIFQPIVATAQVVDLRQRLSDIPGEVDRFLTNLPESERAGWSQRDEGGVETARLRARIQNLPSGQVIAVTVEGGERFEGELAESDTEAFTLWIEDDSRSGRVEKRLRYEEIDTAVLPEWKGWMAPERIHSLDSNQRLELLLTNGAKLTGRLLSTSAQEVVIRLGGDEERTFDMEAVASVRKRGMSGTTIGLIVVLGWASFIGLMFLLAAGEE